MYGHTNTLPCHQTFKQSTTTFTYDSYKIRLRKRFFDAGDFFIDPLLYLEYIGRPNTTTGKFFETKLITAKDINNINISYNLELAIEKTKEYKNEVETEHFLAIGYSINPKIKVGIEYFVSEEKSYLGPTTSFGLGKNWFTIGYQKGSQKADNFRVRALLGLGF